MIVLINENLRVKNTDKLNWDVEKMRITPEKKQDGTNNPNAGKEVWEIVGHYPTLELACKKSLDYALLQDEEKTIEIKEAISLIKKAKEDIINAILLQSELKN